MCKNFLTSLAVVPLLLGFSYAAQNWSVDPPQPFGFPSEDSGTGSYLGVDISDVTSERISALKLKEEKGVEVTMVDQDAPAGKAGMKEHDVIMAMNGTPIESQVQLKRMIRETPPGRVVTFDISRDGQPMSIKVQLADRRKQYVWKGPDMKDFHVEIPAISINPQIEVPQINVMVVRSSARSGLMVENITPQLGEFFGVKNGNGVLVRSVEKGSRGEKAGFRAGDVIVKINDQPVHDTGDFTEVMHSRDSGSITVSVIRDRKEQNLNLTLPPHKESGALIEEESSGEPVLNAEDESEIGDAEDEVAQLAPEMELASEESTQADQAVGAMRQAQCTAQQDAETKELPEQFKAQAEALKSALDQLRQEQRKVFLPQAQEKMKRERERMKRQQERLRMEIERLRQETRTGGFDI
ncbi:MAG TPA: PDZ domain-containing protein [Candidatus Sulfotelmatobacter sp.]|nr:PDZ domain-containing protein [Candidatus Sulfotelmatobacter sp.]